MNNNSKENLPNFKKSKRTRTGYYNETPTPKKSIKLNNKNSADGTPNPIVKVSADGTLNPIVKVSADGTPNPIVKVSVKKSIKNAISSAIEYVKSFKRKSKKNMNNNELQSTITIFEENKLEILESDMIKMVDNVKDADNGAIEDSNIMNKFEDVIKNLTIELHHAIGYTEQTNAIEQIKANEQPTVIAQPIVIEQPNINQHEKNLHELNNILNFLADNILDRNKKKKELSFSELTVANRNTQTIRVISLGIAITYTTLEEFIEKIANRAGTVKSLCWVAGCPDQFNTELKKFIELNNATHKDYDKIFKCFKNMIGAYLSTKYPDIHSKIQPLINTTTGGKKMKPKKVTISAKKPKKVTSTKKPKKVTISAKKLKK
jgi:hypothetical protein